MPTSVILIPSGGSSQTSSGSQISGTLSVNRQDLFQVIGLVPLTPCDYEDCRYDQDCYFLKTFGNIIDGVPEELPSYENDFNTFLIKYPAYATGKYPFTWIIEKADIPFYDSGNVSEWEWNNVAYPIDNTYGPLYKLGDIIGFPAYTMFQVNWGKVLNAFGPGFYRIKADLYTRKVVVVIVSGIPIATLQTEEISCMTSEIFKLDQFSCEKADGTIKFETAITGSIGSIDQYETVFNLCGIKIYDSIRLRGFFGYETTPKYIETLLEHQSGQIDEINNKLLNKFVGKIYRAPKWVHDRLKSYGFMADNILVSDYNINNSDYFIKQKGIRLQGAYEPTYFDNKNFQPDKRHLQRTSDCKADFREDVESVIKSLCCPC